MAQSAGRLTCPRCGANNFDTVTACWKCSAPLSVSSAAPVAVTPYAMPEVRTPQAPPVSAPANAYPVVPGGGGMYPISTGDSGAAKRAAIALALTMPWLGLPVGWVFMMIEDHRKQAIGRLCANWSMVALVFHLLLMFVAMQSVGSLLSQTVQILKSVQQNQSEGGGSAGGLGGGRLGGGIGTP